MAVVVDSHKSGYAALIAQGNYCSRSSVLSGCVLATASTVPIIVAVQEDGRTPCRAARWACLLVGPSHLPPQELRIFVEPCAIADG